MHLTSISPRKSQNFFTEKRQHVETDVIVGSPKAGSDPKIRQIQDHETAAAAAEHFRPRLHTNMNAVIAYHTTTWDVTDF